MNEPIKLEELVLIHRYLYYVMAEPVISDHSYDILEKQARAVCKETSPVHKVGSSLPSSYSEDTIKKAIALLNKETFNERTN